MQYNQHSRLAKENSDGWMMVALMKKLSVLVVDDSELNRLLLARMMHKVQCLWLQGNSWLLELDCCSQS